MIFMNRSMRWLFFFLLNLFVLGAVSFHFQQEALIKKQSSFSAIKQSQYQQVGKISSSYFSQKRNLPQPICVLRFLSFKQKWISNPLKKISLSDFDLSRERNFLVFPFSKDFFERPFSYQFSRLNVLSSQHHPPTGI
jgi:hypothetical protein